MTLHQEYNLRRISLGSNIGCVLIDWTADFGQWLDRLENDAANDKPGARRRLALVTAQLQVLQDLDAVPEHETATLKPVRQSGQYQVWRVSHPYEAGIAVRLIVWFADDAHAVVALFAGDKARIGDVFYESVGTRADAAIEQYKREKDRT